MIKTSDQVRLGMLCAFLGTAAMGLMDACMKWLTQDYPIGEIVFARSFIGIIPLYIWLRFQAKLSKNKEKKITFKVNNYSFVLIRAILSFAAFVSFIIAFSMIPLAESTAISYSMPLFTTIISIFYLAEKLTPHRLVALISGIVGMLIILRPGLGVFQFGSYFALLGSFLFAIVRVITRKYGQTESMEAMTIWVILIWSLCSGLSFFYEFKIPTEDAIYLLLIVGMLGGFVEILITVGCQLAPATVVSMIQYTLLIWASLFDYLLWDRLPDYWTIFGVAIIITSTIYMTVKENKVLVK